MPGGALVAGRSVKNSSRSPAAEHASVAAHQIHASASFAAIPRRLLARTPLSARSPRVRAARGLARRGNVDGATRPTARSEEGGEAEAAGAIHPSSSITGNPRAALASLRGVGSEGFVLCPASSCAR